MGGIKKKVIQILDPTDTIEKDHISFCPECTKDGINSVLGLRILAANEKPAEDYYNWRQCKICATIIPIYETKTESKLEDFVETSNDPFGQGKSIIGNENKKKRKGRKSDMQRLKERIEREKDEDIKKELKIGNTVEIIKDSMN